MDNYRKAYALLVGQVDEALTLLDTNNLLEFSRVREILHKALLDAEDIFLNDETYNERS